MRFPVLVAVVSVLALTGCTKKNPAVCCTTAVQCDEYGFDELTPCQGFEVCIDGECEPPTCTTSADCAESSPYCVNTVCTATCDGDESCTGTGFGAYCSPDGACVECLSSEQCTDAGAAVCDTVGHSCRPCTADNECVSGICLAAEGTCAADEEVVFLGNGGADRGVCSRSAPCRTIAYGLDRLTASRRILKLIGADFDTGGGAILAQDVYLDGSGTRITRTGTGPILTVTGQASVTLEGLRVVSPTSIPAIDVVGGATTNAVMLSLMDGGQALHVGEADTVLNVAMSNFIGTSILCDTTANLFVRESEFEDGRVVSEYCDVTVARSYFEHSNSTMFSFSHTVGTIENNVVVLGGEGRLMSANDSLSTIVRFNTFVRSSDANVQEVNCNLGFEPTFSSNIFALNNSDPIDPDCVVDHSLFDASAGSIPGTGNVVAAFDDIFVDATGDYRPAPGSMALSGADPTQVVTEDYAGGPRPNPQGTTSDIGAYEVP
jgi:hypothetical protein